jgi:dGTPase
MTRRIKKTSKSCGRIPIIEDYKRKKRNKILDFRLNEENQRNCWEVDRQKILSSLAFWRLQDKTQIFESTYSVHFSNRMTHTLIVNDIAREISKVLKLNIPLTEAIALSHDLGHTPFGHAGEEILNELMKDNKGFAHNIQGARVVIYIEWDNLWDKKDLGLALTWEVISGIILHTTKDKNKFKDKLECKINKDIILTPESAVVFYADEIAQRVLDLEDGLRKKIIFKDDIQNIFAKEKDSELKKFFNTERSYNFRPMIIKKYIEEIISNELLDLDYGEIQNFQNEYKNLNRLDLEFENLIDKIHNDSVVKSMNDNGKKILMKLFLYYFDNWEKLDPKVKENEECLNLTRERVISNWIASMGDKYVKDACKNIN